MYMSLCPLKYKTTETKCLIYKRSRAIAFYYNKESILILYTYRRLGIIFHFLGSATDKRYNGVIRFSSMLYNIWLTMLIMKDIKGNTTNTDVNLKSCTFGLDYKSIGMFN